MPFRRLLSPLVWERRGWDTKAIILATSCRQEDGGKGVAAAEANRLDAHRESWDQRETSAFLESESRAQARRRQACKESPLTLASSLTFDSCSDSLTTDVSGSYH